MDRFAKLVDYDGTARTDWNHALIYRLKLVVAYATRDGTNRVGTPHVEIRCRRDGVPRSYSFDCGRRDTPATLVHSRPLYILSNRPYIRDLAEQMNFTRNTNRISVKLLLLRNNLLLVPFLICKFCLKA